MNAWHSQLRLGPCRHRTCSIVCQAVQRVKLAKRREKLSARQRRRDKYQDVGKPVPALPGTSEFSGRVLTAINSANGPVQLLSITTQHGDFMSADLVAATLTRLAGFFLMDNLTDKQKDAAHHCSLLCIRALQRMGLSDLRPLDLSRVVYSLYRLNEYDKTVFAAVVDQAFEKMSSFQADALSGLGAALGGCGHAPSQEWLKRYQLETYVRMPRFTAQDLANTLSGLAALNSRPSDVWLEVAQRRLREVIPVSGATPPALLRIGWSLATLQVRPSFNWTLYYLGEVRQRIDLLTCKELATAAWICARWGHTPDPLFLEAWHKAVTRKMGSFDPESLVLGLQSAAQWGLSTLLPGKLLAVLLPHSQTLFHSLSGPQLILLLWSMVSLRVRPDEGWMDSFSERSEACIGELGPQDLANAMWSFAKLRYQPSEVWEQRAVQQVSTRLADFTPAQLGVVIWGWRSVELSVPPLWDQVFLAAASQVYPPEQVKDITRLLGILAEEHTSP